MSFIIEMFSYPFIVRAFIVGVLVSLCAALLTHPCLVMLEKITRLSHC